MCIFQLPERKIFKNGIQKKLVLILLKKFFKKIIQRYLGLNLIFLNNRCSYIFSFFLISVHLKFYVLDIIAV